MKLGIVLMLILSLISVGYFLLHSSNSDNEKIDASEVVDSKLNSSENSSNLNSSINKSVQNVYHIVLERPPYIPEINVSKAREGCE